MKNRKWLFMIALGTITAFSVNAMTGSKSKQSTSAHHVGDCYGGGIIFYVNKAKNSSTKQHGLIVALTDVPKSYEWDLLTINKNVANTQPDLFTGSKNTQIIINTLDKNNAAAAYATQTFNQGNQKDWYLPSKEELSTLYWQSMMNGGSKFWKRCNGNALSGATYWSSTQSRPKTAWAVSFAGGVIVVANKQSPLLVRAIRAF